jgi:hypothetical protein
MNMLQRAFAVLVPALLAGAAHAGTVHVGVDASKTWLSYATVFEPPTQAGEDRGPFAYGQFYGPAFYATPPGTVVGPIVQLRPNTTLGAAETDTGNPFYSFWWKDNGVGGVVPNKIIQDGFYIQDDSLAGNQIVFTGFAVANTLAPPYVAKAYVIDTIGPDYLFNAVHYVPLVAGQAFSVTHTVPAGHHVAYGIEVLGPNARVSDLASLGVVQVTAVPEPASAVLFALGLAALLRKRRA